MSSILQDVYDEIGSKKAALDKIREKGDTIAQRSSDPRLSNSMMQLSTKFQALCSLARVGTDTIVLI